HRCSCARESLLLPEPWRRRSGCCGRHRPERCRLAPAPGTGLEARRSDARLKFASIALSAVLSNVVQWPNWGSLFKPGAIVSRREAAGLLGLEAERPALAFSAVCDAR